jgi:hypothetical protein
MGLNLDFGLDWRVALKSLLWLLAAFWLLGTFLWPLSFYVVYRWGRWVWRGSRAGSAQL